MNDTTTAEPRLTREALTGTPRGSRRWTWIAGAIVAAAAAIAGGYALYESGNDAKAVRYRTQPVVRGELVVTVSATGNLQPTNKVDIGSELSGTIEKVFVDDNDPVKKGQVLAQLDLSKLNDQVERSRSALASAQARVNQAGATLAEARATLERLRQVRELSGGKVPSQAELSAAEAAVARAIADAASAKASVTETGAALRSDETNVRKASIRSPINGVVLARKVDPGQTVAASLQAPVLFQLAEDLRQMELQVDVDEADVGRVRDEQVATFTVDAYPGRRYPAKVLRVGYGSQVKDNVVTYPTLLSVNNDDASLRPGMTATAEITAARHANALLVPNTALRFTPAPGDEAAKAASGGLVSKLMPRPPRPNVRRANNASRAAEQRVWVLKEGQPVAVAVTVGLSDGTRTEITGGALAPDAAVIVEALQAAGK